MKDFIELIIMKILLAENIIAAFYLTVKYLWSRQNTLLLKMPFTKYVHIYTTIIVNFDKRRVLFCQETFVRTEKDYLYMTIMLIFCAQWLVILLGDSNDHPYSNDDVVKGRTRRHYVLLTTTPAINGIAL